MKVALINPGHNKKWGVIEPLNLGYIASYLEQHGVCVRIVDELAGQNIIEELRKFNPDVVGVTATTPLVSRAYEILASCKKNGFFTVIGGVHATVMPDEAKQHADAVIVGEGEENISGTYNWWLGVRYFF